ncbi:Lipoxygenasey domain-containing protein [Echinococcus granulosus]|uniref:Lipoxygenasey domain-containing protein n=1 Tax=Echinococcus granulosus TaxID=6210 RepID=W6UKG1_ECHGR|nr:Lipoxygenasey domain-containing protein [Echinococcus granulosus]EUB61656.1 Lipoxygenasey domain-containing protein [Echinococcus granulosus]
MCPNLQITHGGVAGDTRRCENDLCDCCMQWPKQSKEMSLLSLENRPLDEYWFFADRWLPPRDEKGGQSFCELLPAKADGTPLSTERRTMYQIRLRTGNLFGGGTSAQVYLTLIGEKSESGEFIFPNSKGLVFAKDREAVFKVEAIGLGEVRKIRLRHDNSGPSPDWYLQEVIVSANENGDERTYYFPCNQWLTATTDGSGRLLREFTAASTTRSRARSANISVTIFYEFKIYTSDIVDAGTKASVFVVLCGSKGRKTSEVQLKGVFKRGGCEVLHVDLEDVGEPLQSLCIKLHNQGSSAAWHLDRVEVRPMGSKLPADEVYIFKCNRWITDLDKTGVILNATTGKRQLSSAAFAEETNTYEITFTTGSISNAVTPVRAYLCLIGADGRTEERQLVPVKDSTEPFQPGKTDLFIWEGVPLREVTKICLRHDNTSLSPNWYVDKVNVRQITSQKSQEPTKTFICNRWISSSNEEFIPMSYKVSTPSPAPSLDSRRFDLPEANFELPTIPSLGKLPPIPSESSVPSLPLDMPLPSPPPIDLSGRPQIATVQQESNDMVMKMPSSSQDPLPPLSPTEEEEGLRLSAIPKSTTNSGNIVSQIEAEWGITSAVLQREDELTSKQYYFTEWQFEEVNQQTYRCSEITSFPPAKPSVTSYKIRIKTSDLPHANTNANVYLRLIGEIVESADIHLKESETNRTSFERDQIDQFTIKNLPNLGELTGCRLWHDNRMPAGAWHCKWIYVVEVPPEGSHLSPQSWYFPCNRWLRGDGRSQVVPLDLLPLDAKAAPALAFCEPETSNSPQAEELKIAQHPSERIDETGLRSHLSSSISAILTNVEIRTS